MEIIKTRRDTANPDRTPLTNAQFLSGRDFQSALTAAHVNIRQVTAFTRIADPSQYVPANTFFDVSGSLDQAILCGWGDSSRTLYWYSAADRVFLDRSASSMFAGFISCASFDLSGVYTAGTEDFQAMFEACDQLETLDLSSFCTTGTLYSQGGRGMDLMFMNCGHLRTIYASELFVPSDIDSYDMFYGCVSLVGGNGTRYDEDHTDGTYARIDRTGAPGYFTQKP